ncbi:MAG: ECF-type sigma factor [Verrucomicrobiales bacterium]
MPSQDWTEADAFNALAHRNPSQRERTWLVKHPSLGFGPASKRGRDAQFLLFTEEVTRHLQESIPFLMSDDVTHLLNGIDDGDPNSAERLLKAVYEELRKLAATRMAQERPGKPFSNRPGP